MDVHTYHTDVPNVQSFSFVSYAQIQGWLWLKTCLKKTEYR